MTAQSVNPSVSGKLLSQFAQRDDMSGIYDIVSIEAFTAQLRENKKTPEMVEKYVWGTRPMPYYAAWYCGPQSTKQKSL